MNNLAKYHKSHCRVLQGKFDGCTCRSSYLARRAISAGLTRFSLVHKLVYG